MSAATDAFCGALGWVVDPSERARHGPGHGPGYFVHAPVEVYHITMATCEALLTLPLMEIPLILARASCLSSDGNWWRTSGALLTKRIELSI